MESTMVACMFFRGKGNRGRKEAMSIIGTSSSSVGKCTNPCNCGAEARAILQKL